VEESGREEEGVRGSGGGERGRWRVSNRLGARALGNGRERGRVYAYISMDGCVALRE